MILGRVARRAIDRSQGTIDGYGFADAGISIGLIGVLVNLAMSFYVAGRMSMIP